MGHEAHALPPNGHGAQRLDASILILLVEDEHLIRMNLEEELRDAGFDLVAVRDGVKAMAELDADATRFRGLITDIRLGDGPTGWEIARHARELVPGIPIVYMSGDSAHEWDSRGVPNSVMVTKPFVTVQINTALSNLLNEVSSQSQ